MENLRGAKIYIENLRAKKNFHHFPKNTPTGYLDLKKTGPLMYTREPLEISTSAVGGFPPRTSFETSTVFLVCGSKLCLLFVEHQTIFVDIFNDLIPSTKYLPYRELSIFFANKKWLILKYLILNWKNHPAYSSNQRPFGGFGKVKPFCKPMVSNVCLFRLSCLLLDIFH